MPWLVEKELEGQEGSEAAERVKEGKRDRRSNICNGWGGLILCLRRGWHVKHAGFTPGLLYISSHDDFKQN